MRVAAKTATQVPILGPLWLPDAKAAGSRLMPPGWTFAATVQAAPTRYQMNFWLEAHALAANSPKVVQDSGDPSVTPIATVSGQRYHTSSEAARAVMQNNDNGDLRFAKIPKTAHRISIAPETPGWVWRQTSATGSKSLMITWHERGWLIETDPSFVPAYETAVSFARHLVPKVMAPMPGRTGTITIAVAADGQHTTATWQRGKIAYSVFADYGVSSATTVISSLYPASSRPT